MQLGSAFVDHFYIFLLRHSYVIYIFDRITFFDNVRITLYFGTFELRMEITLQLRFGFPRHCDVFFITSQVHYLFVRCSYVFLMTLELRYILVRSNYVLKLRYKMVVF